MNDWDGRLSTGDAKVNRHKECDPFGKCSDTNLALANSEAGHVAGHVTGDKAPAVYYYAITASFHFILNMMGKPLISSIGDTETSLF